MTYEPNGENSASYTWVSVLLALLALVAGVILSVRYYKKYDPLPNKNAANKPIGGWMILPLIGLLISPIRISLDLFTEDFFNGYIWAALVNPDLGLSRDLVVLIALELVYNVLFLVFNIFVLILFFERRTSLPMMMTIYYSATLFIQVADAIAVSVLSPDLMDEIGKNESIKGIMRAIVGAAIWIPYFNLSERVKDTFCKQHKPVEPEPENIEAVEAATEIVQEKISSPEENAETQGTEQKGGTAPS